LILFASPVGKQSNAPATALIQLNFSSLTTFLQPTPKFFANRHFVSARIVTSTFPYILCSLSPAVGDLLLVGQRKFILMTEPQFKKLIEKLEEIRHQLNMNDSSSGVSSLARDVDSIKNDIAEIRTILREKSESEA
jgi:ribosomal protein L29